MFIRLDSSFALFIPWPHFLTKLSSYSQSVPPPSLLSLPLYHFFTLSFPSRPIDRYLLHVSLNLLFSIISFILFFTQAYPLLISISFPQSLVKLGTSSHPVAFLSASFGQFFYFSHFGPSPALLDLFSDNGLAFGPGSAISIASTAVMAPLSLWWSSFHS